MSDTTQQYINVHSKSQMIGFILTLLLGPLGLFYSSWIAALILCVITISLASTIIIPLIIWVLAILISFDTVSRHNEKVKATAGLYYST